MNYCFCKLLTLDGDEKLASSSIRRCIRCIVSNCCVPFGQTVPWVGITGELIKARVIYHVLLVVSR